LFSGEEILTKRVTALTLVIAAAFLHGVTAISTEAVEVGGGPGQRWDCVAFLTDDGIYVVNLDGSGLTQLMADGRSPAFGKTRPRLSSLYR